MNGQDNKKEELNNMNEQLQGRLKEADGTGKKVRDYEGIEDKPEKEPKKKGKKATKIIAGILIVLLLIIVGTVGTAAYLRYKGEQELKAQKELEMSAPDNVAVENNGDLVVYNGEKYCYNHNIITVLCLGIDKTQSEVEQIQESEVGVTQGQADTVVLAVIDSETGKTTLMNISRNSMVEVNRYSSSGKLVDTVDTQLCLAYSYGLGEDGPGGNMMRSVSRLLYGIPIDSYAAINLSAIGVMNDAVGGVEVEVIEDLSMFNPKFYVGNVIKLEGKDAEFYIRSRDSYSGNADSNSLRMDRQKQYIAAFAAKAFQMTKEDVTVPLTLFDIASDYMETDLDAARVSYLMSLVSKVGLDESSFLTIPGESVFGEGGVAEFHPDETQLYEMILNTFYEKVQ